MGYRATRIGFNFFPNPEHSWYLEGFGGCGLELLHLHVAHLPKEIERTMRGN